MRQILLDLSQKLIIPEFLQKTLKDQEYVLISYNESHDHLPLLWRVLTGVGSSSYGPIGHAFINPNYYPYPYAYVYLDRIYHNKKLAKDLGKSDLKLSEWAGRQIWGTFIHEFFHLYFNERFERDDTYDYRYDSESKNFKKQNYEYTYSRRWEHNERIIDKLAEVLTDIFFKDPIFQDFATSWCSCFTDFDNHNLVLEGDKKMDKKRPGGEFGKRLKDRFSERETLSLNKIGKGDGGKDPEPVFSIPPKNRFIIQAFFNFQGIAVKPVCECGTYIYDRAYWIGHRGPLCYSCYLRGDKK